LLGNEDEDETYAAPVKRDHRELPVWQASIDLVEACCRFTEAFPHHEVYALRSQMRRAAISVPSNIAEGAARKSTAELIQFLHVASGSLAELDAQLEIAKRLGYGNTEQMFQPLLDTVHRQLVGLIATLKAKPS
jgi:four helix bundle protein